MAPFKKVLEDNHVRHVFIMGLLVTEALVREISQAAGISIECFILSDGCTLQEHDHGMKCVSCSDAKEMILQDTECTSSLKPTRKRILALCGARSNNEVTKLQLENLHITEDEYELVFLHGEIKSTVDLVSGPFYSWLDSSSEDKMYPHVYWWMSRT